MALEQRELRSFIEDLRPARPFAAAAPEPLSLAGLLAPVRDRLAPQWKVPISIDISEPERRLPAAEGRAVALMVHEAVVNALKHASPTRVRVMVTTRAGSLVIAVGDDGSGFSFSGRYEHAALVNSGLGPASLRDRVASLGGSMAIESTPSGSVVELRVPLPPAGG